jgi:GWxTD domain-containing protein
LGQPESQPSIFVPLLSAVAVVLIAAALGQSQIVLTNPYVKWLDEDVAYIITNVERAAFVGLSTDAERDRFIEQFWLRRDPTPGTRENEFKDEHYRRIEYANEHFASRLPLPAGLGWKTDRGRIYIMFGPPNEKETHAAGTYTRSDGTTQSFASEFWLYRYLQGIGTDVLLEFDDAAGTEEFKQSKDPAVKQKILNH